jgi:hypothetical protein
MLIEVLKQRPILVIEHDRSKFPRRVSLASTRFSMRLKSTSSRDFHRMKVNAIDPVAAAGRCIVAGSQKVFS